VYLRLARLLKRLESKECLLLAQTLFCSLLHVAGIQQALSYDTTHNAYLSIGLTAVVCCAAPGTAAAAGVMPVSMDRTS
jgi:hypothetical protein